MMHGQKNIKLVYFMLDRYETGRHLSVFTRNAYCMLYVSKCGDKTCEDLTALC